MALVTTFATTPLTSLLYPKWYQDKLAAWKRADIDWDGNPLKPEDDSEGVMSPEKKSGSVRRLLVYLRFDNLPSLFTFISLLGAGSLEPPPPKVHHLNHTAGKTESTEYPTQVVRKKRPLEVHGVRLLELTERESSVMKVSEIEEYTFKDPVVNTFRTFGQLNNVAVSGGVTVVPQHSYADTLISKASDMASDLVLVPWSETGSMSEHHTLLPSISTDKFAQGTHSSFISAVLKANAPLNIGIFVNRGFGGGANPESSYPRGLFRTVSGLSVRSLGDTATAPTANRSHHIFLPFFGGADDRFALRFVLQLAQNENVTATILHIEAPSVEPTYNEHHGSTEVQISPTHNFPSPLSHPQEPKTETGVSTTTNPNPNLEDAFFASIRDSLPANLANRVVFQSASPTGQNALSLALNRAKAELGLDAGNAGDLMVVGRSNGMAWGYLGDSSGERVSVEAKRALGVVGAAVVGGRGVRGSLLVVKARGGE